MNGVFYIGVIGLEVQQCNFDLIVQNVVNVNIGVYKCVEMCFVVFVFVLVVVLDVVFFVWFVVEVVVGVMVVGIGWVFVQGDLCQMDKLFDFVISGDGFFEVFGFGG